MSAQQQHFITTAFLSVTTDPVAVGDVLCLNAAGDRYVVASLSNRTSAVRRSACVALTSGDDSNIAVEGQYVGVVPASITGLGVGSASSIRVSDAGRLERAAFDSGDDVCGRCDADGTAYVCFPLIGLAAAFGALTFTAAGDLAGDETSQMVIGIHGYPIMNSPSVDERWLRYYQDNEPPPGYPDEWLEWSELPTDEGDSHSGDVVDDGAQKVVGIQGHLIDNDPGPNKYLVYRHEESEAPILQWESVPEPFTIPSGSEDDVIGLNGSGGLKNLGPMSGGGTAPHELTIDLAAHDLDHVLDLRADSSVASATSLRFIYSPGTLVSEVTVLLPNVSSLGTIGGYPASEAKLYTIFADFAGGVGVQLATTLSSYSVVVSGTNPSSISGMTVTVTTLGVIGHGMQFTGS